MRSTRYVEIALGPLHMAIERQRPAPGLTLLELEKCQNVSLKWARAATGKPPCAPRRIGRTGWRLGLWWPLRPPRMAASSCGLGVWSPVCGGLSLLSAHREEPWARYSTAAPHHARHPSGNTAIEGSAQRASRQVRPQSEDSASAPCRRREGVRRLRRRHHRRDRSGDGPRPGNEAVRRRARSLQLRLLRGPAQGGGGRLDRLPCRHVRLLRRRDGDHRLRQPQDGGDQPGPLRSGDQPYLSGHGPPLRDERGSGPAVQASRQGKVEQSVLLVERWVLARLRNQRFFSLAELNLAISELVAEPTPASCAPTAPAGPNTTTPVSVSPPTDSSSPSGRRFPPSAPARARGRQTLGLPEGYRPRGAPDPAGTACPNLDPDHPATPHRRPRQSPATMSMLRQSHGRFASGPHVMTQ